MKKLRRLIYLMMIASLAVALYSCSEEDVIDSISIDDETLVVASLKAISSDGGSRELQFESSSDWSITIDDTRTSSWLSVTPSSGKAGSVNVSIIVAENETLDERQSRITISAGSIARHINVTQKQKYALTLTSSRFEVPQKGDEIKVEVKSNFDFDITIADSCKSWISSFDTKALTTHELTFNISPNKETTTRNGIITISGGGASEEIKVFQAGGKILILNEKKYDILGIGGTVTVELSSNFDFDVVMPDVDWIEETATRAISSHTRYFTISENGDYESRLAEIIFKSNDGTVSETVTIKQGQKVIDKTYQEPQKYNTNRLLIKYGLQLHCWVESEEGTHPIYITPEDWRATGFNGPTFFIDPLYNKKFFRDFPGHQWSMAKAPDGRGNTDETAAIHSMPTDEYYIFGYLSVNQHSQLNGLSSVCFGDEEHYADDLPDNMKEWYSISRKNYPDVMVHNNQWPTQWYTWQLQDYVTTAKPDLITFDGYLYNSTQDEKNRGSTLTANNLMKYREVAMQGWDGDGVDYISFGQYTQGYLSGWNGTPEGGKLYWPTESQIRLYSYMTWTLGGKWVNWFRFLQAPTHADGTLINKETLSLLLYDGISGQHTPQMAWTKKCNEESKFIGDHLVRLLTTQIYYKMGHSDYTDPDGKPDEFDGIKEFKDDVESCPIKKISSSVNGTTDKPADIYIGTFRIIPTNEEGDPSFFGNSDAKYFMVTNAYTDNNLEHSAEDLAQIVNISVEKGKKLSWLNPYTRKDEQLTNKSTEGNYEIYTVTIWGGSGILFYLED